MINIKTTDPSTGYSLCVYPQESRRKRSSWIMWISEDGSAVLYAEREESGAISGEPVHLPANINRALAATLSEDDSDD